MLRRKQKGNPLDGVQQALDKAELAALRAQTDQVYVSDDVLDYIVPVSYTHLDVYKRQLLYRETM